MSVLTLLYIEIGMDLYISVTNQSTINCHFVHAPTNYFQCICGIFALSQKLEHNNQISTPHCLIKTEQKHFRALHNIEWLM